MPLIAYYQENIDHRDPEDLRIVREWLKIEFHGKYITMGGKAVKVAKSTKGELNKGFLERVIDWAGEQGYQTELLLPEDYKYWKDKVYPNGGPEHYIDYLVECGKLKSRVGISEVDSI